MEAMQITPSRYLAAKLVQNSGISCFRQLGFASFSSGKRKDRSFCVRARSYKEGGEFVSSNQEKTEEGVLVGDERDEIGSAVGFPFIPNSGQNHSCCDTQLHFVCLFV